MARIVAIFVIHQRGCKLPVEVCQCEADDTWVDVEFEPGETIKDSIQRARDAA
jgi:hypothetical protein